MKKINTIVFSLLLLFLSLTACQQNRTVVRSGDPDEIPIGFMVQVGMDSAVFNMIDTALVHGTYPKIHSMLVAQAAIPPYLYDDLNMSTICKRMQCFRA